jgi:hypothetical protein
MLYLIGGGVNDEGIKDLALVEAYSLAESY